LPEDGRLYRVAQSIYSDEATYYLVFDLNGVLVSYEVGNLPEADGCSASNFPGAAGPLHFDHRQRNFDEARFHARGLVDEIMDAKESLCRLR